MTVRQKSRTASRFLEENGVHKAWVDVASPTCVLDRLEQPQGGQLFETLRLLVTTAFLHWRYHPYYVVSLFGCLKGLGVGLDGPGSERTGEVNASSTVTAVIENSGISHLPFVKTNQKSRFLCEISQSLNVVPEFNYLESLRRPWNTTVPFAWPGKFHCLFVDLDHRLWVLFHSLFLPIKWGFTCLLCLSPMPAWSQRNEIM